MSLRYKTFDNLMASVEEDLSRYADNNLIKRRRYIKVAKYCNSFLGIKMNKVKEYVVSIQNGKGDLPPDFYSAISAFIITEESLGFMYAPILGTHTIEYTKEEIINKGLPFEDYGCINKCGDGCFYVTRLHTDKEIIYKDIKPVSISESSVGFFSKYSPNLGVISKYQIDIDNNQITCNFSSGQLYLSYICDMVDEKGNLLVLDDDIVNGFYEWSIKEAILTDIAYNGDADVKGLAQDAGYRAMIKRNEAASLFLDPGYQKLKEWSDRVEYDFYLKQVKMFV